MIKNQSRCAEDEFTRFAFEFFFHSLFIPHHETEPSPDGAMANIENADGTLFTNDAAINRTALKQRSFESAAQ
jgi:hypothetical protein